VAEPVSEIERTARVVSRRALSPRVSEVVLELGGESPFRWRAGQHLRIHLGGPEQGGPFPYSIASVWDGTDPPRLELAIGPGTGSDLLARVALGSVLRVSGPFGSFTLPEASGALLVGAGTGIAPLRAHALEWLARPGAAPLALLAGARAPEDLLWHAELGDLAQREPRFRYEPVLSQPGIAWRGRSGRVQEHVTAVLEALPGGALVRVCGGTAMVEGTLAIVLSLGVSAERLASESY
jgi:NAD(P)H-flavin reductase